MQIGKQTACPYPPVFPIVLYNGKRPWKAARETAELIEPLIPQEYIPRLRYYLIEERSFSQAMLAGIRNLVALLFLAENLPPEELALSMDAFFTIIESEDSNAVALFGRWINDYFRQVAGSDADAPHLELRTGEEPSMLAENLRIWRKKYREEDFREGRQEGRQEGRREGRSEERREVAQRLLQRGMSLPEVAEVTRLSPEELLSLSGMSTTKG
jgi:predicted transposase/invertase (TIGR01784 family)